jgi:D-tyrosyl-tRNA(Tyr) deacylase
MIAVLQRVKEASITVDSNEISRIERGLLILLGVMDTDTAEDCKYLVGKVSNFRIFNDDNNKMNLSIKDVGGEILVVSQFTLCADWLKGRRPSFVHAADSPVGEQLYEKFVDLLKAENINTKTGEFGAMMNVLLVNEGPVTFVLDSTQKR